VYTQIGTVVLTSENRICTENGQLYPNSGKTAERLLNGLNLEGDILSFADMTENRLLHLNLTTGVLYDDFAEEAQFQLYQNIRVYADGGLTASLEQGSTLVGVSLQDGTLVEYSVFKGLPSLLRFLGQTVGFFLLALFLRFVFGLLFLRWKKSRRGKHTIQFFGIASRITAASLLVTLVIISLFGSSIFKTTEEINRFWITSDEQSALRYFSWNISEFCPLTEEDKLPTISEEAYQSLQKRMEAYKQKAYTEGKSATESFYWMAVSEDKLYCIYGEEITGTTEAGYLVSLFAADTIQKAMESGESVHFSDNRTIGVQQYVVLPVESTEDTTVQMAVVLETDGYAQKASTTQDFPGVMAVIALCSLLMLLVVNLLLRGVLRRIKKLRTQIDAYEKTGDPSVFVMRGKDEIADTTAALEAMSGTLEVYMKDVTEGNANYSRLISNGILTLLGKEKITQVQPGMCCRVEGTAVRFAFGQCPMASPEQRQKLAAACQEKGGVVVGFCLERMDVFFPKEAELAAFLEAYLSAPQSETVPVFLSYGTLQAGSAGTETNAYLTVTTAIFETIRRMQESTASLTLRCTLEKACQEFLVPQLKRYRCVSVETDSTPLYTIVERENA
jgi:methyl-accepting chemotaxis protein